MPRSLTVVVEALDPADERAAHALEAGLLADLAHDRLGEQLARLDPSARHRPLPRGGSVTPADQQEPTVEDGDATDAELRARHRRSLARSRWTRMARAVRP